MQIKVKYTETYDREHKVTINDDEFLEFLNEGASEPYGSIGEAQSDLGEGFNSQVTEYLDCGDDDEWVGPALDPFANVFDRKLVDVEVL
jgi:hypothetical protein